jgi:hypothetical protein
MRSAQRSSAPTVLSVIWKSAIVQGAPSQRGIARPNAWLPSYPQLRKSVRNTRRRSAGSSSWTGRRGRPAGLHFHPGPGFGPGFAHIHAISMYTGGWVRISPIWMSNEHNRGPAGDGAVPREPGHPSTTRPLSSRPDSDS